MSAHRLATELAVSQRVLSDVRGCREWLIENFSARNMSADMFVTIIESARDIRESMRRELEAFGVSAPADIAWEG